MTTLHFRYPEASTFLGINHMGDDQGEVEGFMIIKPTEFNGIPSSNLLSVFVFNEYREIGKLSCIQE